MRRGGFTLIETVVALGVTALVLAGLYGAVLRATAARAYVTARLDRVAEARTVLMRLAGDLEAAVAPDPADLLGSTGFVVDTPPGDRQSATLLLTTRAGRNGMARRVRYGVRTAPGGLELVRGEGPAVTSTRPVRVDVPVLERLGWFRVRCLADGAWYDRWTEPALPAAVEIRLGLEESAANPEELATIVVLPVRRSW